MITNGELSFIREVFNDLVAIADPNEYFEGEVKEALDLLDQLSQYDMEQFINIYNQLQEINNHDRTN